MIIPGYGNSAFLFAEAGAKSIVVYDKDPVTIAWIKAFKKYYHYREFDNHGKPYPSIGELLTALTCWYPPLMTLGSGKFIKLINMIHWAINPKSLRRTYIFYMLSLTRNAIMARSKDNFELDKNIKFFPGELSRLKKEQAIFDTAFVPYLLGIRNGIENEQDIVRFIKELTHFVPSGHILVCPSRSTKEFHVIGQRYFEMTGHSNIQAIPGLKNYVVGADHYWFKTQGLAIFGLLKQDVTES